MSEKPISPLRQRMLEDMSLRGFTPDTQRDYIRAREIVVVQLQFLDLMIPEDCGAVPMDAATRVDLIDLMARVLAVVFHEEGGRVNDRSFVQSQDQTGSAAWDGGG